MHRKSRPIEIVPYQETWVEEFKAQGIRLRKITGDSALRIDHIGSTSVPGLAAKDVIDIQITGRGKQNAYTRSRAGKIKSTISDPLSGLLTGRQVHDASI